MYYQYVFFSSSLDFHITSEYENDEYILCTQYYGTIKLISAACFQTKEEDSLNNELGYCVYFIIIIVIIMDQDPSEYYTFLKNRTH